MTTKNENPTTISTQAIKRMPVYLQYLKKLRTDGIQVIAAPAIAVSLNLNEIQVRKDFAAVSTSKGKPKAGFIVQDLIENMEEFLGYHKVDNAVLVGVGSLGRALLSYKGFMEYGLNIVAAFDKNSSIVGSEICGKKVLPDHKLSEMCRRLNIHIGIITVPEEQAQVVCDQLVAGGIHAIWNFAPTHIYTPKEILVKNENMAASLALLLKHLKE